MHQESTQKEIPKLARATLTAFDLAKMKEMNDGETPAEMKVQFNPQTLKITHTNNLETGKQPGGNGIQFKGLGDSKLSVELWFDITAPLPDNKAAKDVRELTSIVRRFLAPIPDKNKEEQKSFIVPGIRFQWGNFIFDGVVESVDENIEFFSEDGFPLRASVSFSIKNYEIKKKPQGQNGTILNNNPFFSHEKPQVKQGESIQQTAGKEGNPLDWQDIARANGIENPRFPTPGIRLDLNI